MARIFEYMKHTITDSVEMNVDGSVTEQNFRYTVPSPGGNQTIQRVNLAIRDVAIKPQHFGGISNGLTNGITADILLPNGEPVIPLDGEIPVKNNTDIGNVFGDMRIFNWSMGQDLLVASWKVDESRGENITLLPGQSFQITIADDLSNILQMRIMVQLL